MSGVKGRSGTNKGKDKLFADAVRVAVNREAEDGRKKVMLLADRLVDFALAGEGWAMQQIADRLDGKPAQDSTVTSVAISVVENMDADELRDFIRRESARLGVGVQPARTSNGSGTTH